MMVDTEILKESFTKGFISGSVCAQNLIRSHLELLNSGSWFTDRIKKDEIIKSLELCMQAMSEVHAEHQIKETK